MLGATSYRVPVTLLGCPGLTPPPPSHMCPICDLYSYVIYANSLVKYTCIMYVFCSLYGLY